MFSKIWIISHYLCICEFKGYLLLSIYLSVDRYAFVNNAIVYQRVQLSLTHWFLYRYSEARLLDYMVPFLLFWEVSCIAFGNDCTSLHVHHKCARVPVVSSLTLIFLFLGATCPRWDTSLWFDFIFLTTANIECLWYTHPHSILHLLGKHAY